MSVFYHEFEVRWSDIDANRHLANAAYIQYCAQTRMAFMNQNKMGVRELNRWGIGPVLLHERYSYFKEIYADQKVIVSLEIDGLSDDASLYRFLHRFYLADGTHCATAEATGVWIDMMLRKATDPPEDILLAMANYQTENVAVLTKQDLKSLPFRPENIDPQLFR